MFFDVDSLLEMQKNIGASAQLIAHHTAVVEVAKAISSKLILMDVTFDAQLVANMAAVHDIGKIKVPQELSEPGSKHERIGFEFSQELGLANDLARICVQHSKEEYEELDFEVLIVILADKLWKGKRIEGLETYFISVVSKRMPLDYWATFLDLDSLFESIADDGHKRLLAMPD